MFAFASMLSIKFDFGASFWSILSLSLVSIYKIVKASTLSETARALTRRSKFLYGWSRTPGASTRRLFRSRVVTRPHALLRAVTSPHTLSRACWRHCWRHPRQPLLRCCWRHLLASAANVILWLWVFDSWLLGWPLALIGRWLWPLTFLGVDFFCPGAPYQVFRVDFIFAVYFCIFCF